MVAGAGLLIRHAIRLLRNHIEIHTLRLHVVFIGLSPPASSRMREAHP